MQPIATYGAALSVSVCLSVGHLHEPCKNGWTDRDAVWGLTVDCATLYWPLFKLLRDAVLTRSHGKGQFVGLSNPLKSIGSLCCGVRSKWDRSILSNSMTCDAAFCQNSSTTYYFYQTIIKQLYCRLTVY